MPGHIWTQPGLQDLADDILGKDCEHISGLEVEGRHPRALMESALSLLNQVIGLVACARTALTGHRFERAGLTSYAITAFVLQSLGNLSCCSIGLIFGQQRPDDPRVLVGHCDTCLGGSDLALLLRDPLIPPI